MATQTITNTGHDELIHDAVLDFYGRRLATCSSDKTIKIFDIDQDNTPRLIETLRGHDGPIWSLSWAHPKFGPALLASASYSGQILIHRESPNSAATAGPGAGSAASSWTLLHESRTHAASVNGVAWAPHEVGNGAGSEGSSAILAAASSDGTVSLLELSGQGVVQIAHFSAHGLGANAVSWAPAQAAGSLSLGAATPGVATPAGGVTKKFVTGGSDGLVKIWEIQGPTGQSVEPVLVAELPGHTDWVRGVAWSPSVLRKSYVASASEDRTVRIWTSEDGVNWTSTQLPTFDAAAWTVSWSLSGNVLAVSTGDNKVTLWKEKLAGGWSLVKTMDESS